MNQENYSRNCEINYIILYYLSLTIVPNILFRDIETKSPSERTNKEKIRPPQKENHNSEKIFTFI